MIIRITINKGQCDEEKVHIYCPNQINIRRKNIKSKFFEWYDSVDNEEYELASNMYDSNSLEYMMVYWINKHLIEFDYENKASVLEDSVDDIKNCDININIDGYIYY